MKRFIRLICLFLITTSQFTHAEGLEKATNENNIIIQYIEASDIPSDTIVKKVIILDTSNQEVKQESVTSKTAQQSRVQRRSDNTPPQRNSNDGFFDGYKENFKGDPNKDLKPIVKVTESDDAVAKKKKLEEAIEKLEEKNHEQQEIKKRVNQEIEEYNKQVEEENKAKDEEQSKQVKGKTLDTDLLIK